MAVGDETKNKTLTTTWQLLAAGPLLIALEVGDLAELHIAAAPPGVSDPVARLVRGTDREARSYEGTLNIYAKKPAGAIGDVTVSYGE